MGRPLKLNNFIKTCITRGYKGFILHGDGIMEIWAPRHGPDFDPAYEQIHKDYEAYNGRPYKGYTKSNLSLKAAIKKSSSYEVLSNKNCRFIFREKSKEEVDALRRARKAALQKLIEKEPIDNPTPQNVPLTLNLYESLLETQKKQLENKVYVKLEQFEVVETETAHSTDSMESASERFNNGSEPNVEIKTEIIENFNQGSPDFQEKTRDSLLQQTELQSERKESNPPIENLPSISQKIIDRPGPRCKKQFGFNLMEKKAPERLILPKQSETCLVQSTLSDPHILFPSPTSENVIDKPSGMQSFLLIITTQQGSSNLQKKEGGNLPRVEELDTCLAEKTKKSESSNSILASQPRQTNSPLVSSSHQESLELIEEELETAPLIIDLESENSLKSKETDSSNIQSESSPKITNLPFVSSSFQSCLEIQELQCETVLPPVNKELRNTSLKRNTVILEASQLQLDSPSEFRQASLPLISSSHLESPKLLEKQCEIISQHVNVELKSSSKTLKTDAANLNMASGCRQTNSPLVSSSFEVSPKLPEKHQEIIPYDINQESRNSSKRMKTNDNLAGDINQLCSLPLKNSFFENNLKFDESLIELAKKQILEEVAKNSNAESDDLLFLRSLLPYISKIPDNLKLRFRSRIQEVVEEFAAMQPKASI